MPLHEGASWTYRVRSGFLSGVHPLVAERRLAVAGVEGAELTGAMGASRLAWKGDRLLAEVLGGDRYIPPVPLLDLALLDQEGGPGVRSWRGFVVVRGEARDAVAQLSVTRVPPLRDNWPSTVRSTLKIESEGEQVELLTWFAQGKGVVRQEQREDGELHRMVEWLSGP